MRKRRRELEYLVVIEKSRNGYGAFSPDLPGCVALGDTVQEVKRLIKSAIRFHIEGLRQDGLKVPTPKSRIDYVRVAA